jgi:hypothetical protein
MARGLAHEVRPADEALARLWPALDGVLGDQRRDRLEIQRSPGLKVVDRLPDPSALRHHARDV